jgi:hypothetical protein
MPAKRSRFVYVELHDQQADTLMQRLMIRSDEDGVFANAMLLPKDYEVVSIRWLPTPNGCATSVRRASAISH